MPLFLNTFSVYAAVEKDSQELTILKLYHLYIYIYVPLVYHACFSGHSWSKQQGTTTSMYAITNALVFFKYSISIVTRQCYFRTGMLFVRLQLYRSTDLTRAGTDCGNTNNFFSPPKGRRGVNRHTAQEDRNGTRGGDVIELRHLTDIDSRAQSRALWKAQGWSSFVPATLANLFDWVTDNQADEHHVRNAFVISNRDSASKSSPLRRSAAPWTFRGWCTRACRGREWGALF